MRAFFTPSALRCGCRLRLLPRLHYVAHKIPVALFQRNLSRHPFSTIMSRCTTSDSDPTVSTRRYLYAPILYVEQLERYSAGGYHPIIAGDKLHGRYQVAQKLGYGGYSTIWLVLDEFTGKYLAMKVCTADASSHESDVLSHLSSLQRPANDDDGMIGKMMIPSVLDRFKLKGPNGVHACYVTQPAMTSLYDAKEESRSGLFKLNVARSLAAQLALAVEYTHSAGIVHGDLRDSNVLIQAPPDFEYEKLDAPLTEEITRLYDDKEPLPANLPAHATLITWLGEASDKLCLPQARVLLSDFGESFYPAKQKRFYSNAPLANRAPEALFDPNTPLSFPSDVWSLACTIWDIVGQRSIADSFFDKYEDILQQLVDALGIMPLEWWKQWDERHKFFSEDGTPINRYDEGSYMSWEDNFEYCVEAPRRKGGMDSFEPAEREALFAMLRPMLAWRPECRPSVREVLQSEWMVKWALPEAEKVLRA